MKKFLIPVVLCMALLIAAPASATLVGDTISSVLNFDGFTGNFFHPALGFVPAGSSGIQPAATVADPDTTFVEFMYLNGANGLNVDVDAYTISLHEFPVLGPGRGLNSWTVRLFSDFGPNTSIDILYSNFGDSLRVDNTANYIRLRFDGTIPNVENGLLVELGVRIPEPTTLLLLGTGLIGLAGLSRRKFFK